MPWGPYSDRCLVCGSAENEYGHEGLCLPCYKRWLVERFERPPIPRPWSRKHPRCIECGTTEKPHASRGLCRQCYDAWLNARHRPEGAGRGSRGVSHKLTHERLEDLYLKQRLSMGEIAALMGCTRQYVSLLLRRQGIASRSHPAARKLALDKGKFTYEVSGENGLAEVKTRERRTIRNPDFFKAWTRGMAYVLGVICTDGNIYLGRPRSPAKNAYPAKLSITQREPELLEKVARLMTCDYGPTLRPGRGLRGQVHAFELNDPDVIQDLLKLGVTPRKSKTLEWPPVPRILVRDFIRGCWDGDGTVYLERGQGRAGFISASRDFLGAMIDELCARGLPRPTVHEDKRSPGTTYFRYHRRDCATLFHLLYDNTEPDMYLERKYLVFRQVAAQYAALGQSNGQASA